MTDALEHVQPIIGMEIHVQLRTESKLFCACPVRTDAPPNSCVCEVCLGYPGALPVMNRRAFEHAVLTGLALNCTIARHTKWDRKSYFYPDLPKNYQISQYDLPLAHDGFLEFEVQGQEKRVRIRRAHLEEDAGKNIHDSGDATLVDLNRAGTPLLEIVTEPDLNGPDEAFVFCTELQRLVRHLGISDANMQLGQMRFEPNVNLAIRVNGREHRTPIAEIKNINSFRFVRQAIEFEIQRQRDQWQSNHHYVFGRCPNENRGWNAEMGLTEFQRGKEAAHDYRYFPDPDLVPVDVTDELMAKIRFRLVESPVARRRRWINVHGISPDDAETMIAERDTADLFDQVIAAQAPPDVVAKQFVNIWSKLANERSVSIEQLGVETARLAELATMTAEGIVSKTAANQIAAFMLTSQESPRSLAKSAGLIQSQDLDQIHGWVDRAFLENQQAVRDALSHPKKMKAAAGFLRGQVMKISGGQADPKLVATLIEQRLTASRESPGS